MQLFAIILLGAFTGLSLAQSDVTRGVLISGRPATRASCQAGDSGMKCDTCTEALVCNGATQMSKVACLAPYIYCDAGTNTCSSDKSLACASTAASFKCPEEGFYPDPNSCQSYHFCDSSKVAQTWECPANFVYDAVNSNCKRKLLPTDCIVMKCVAAASANTFIVHGTNPNFYAFCDKDLVATLFKCPKNMQFSAGCKFVCKVEGYFPGSAPHQYYHCSKTGATFWAITVTDCPTGYEFNSSAKNCVKKG